MPPSSRYATPGSRLEQLLDAIHDDRYRDVVKYVVLHPTARGLKEAIGEHPARPSGPHPTGHGMTWEAAVEELLKATQRSVREEVDG